jgi:hypothetical protein
MAKPLAAMTFHELSLLGHYHAAALEHTEATQDLIAGFAKALEALEAAVETDRAAHRELLLANVPVNRAEYEAGQIVRRVAQVTYGPEDQPGALHQALFPFGVADTLLAEGEDLLTDLFCLRERLSHVSEAQALKAEVIAELDGVLARLSERLAAHVQADIAATRAREQLEKCRLEFLAVYERDAVAIAKRFPDEPKTQDLYFDERHADFDLTSADADWWPPTSKKCGGRLS